MSGNHARRRARRRRLDQDGFERHQRLPVRARPRPASGCSRRSPSWATAPISRRAGCARARPGSSDSRSRSCGRTTSPSSPTPSSAPPSGSNVGGRRRSDRCDARGRARRAVRERGCGCTDGILFSPERLGQEDIELLEVAVPAGAARRAHVRRPDRPRDDAQRRARPARPPSTCIEHRSPAHRGDRRPPDRPGRHPVGEPSHPRLPRGARGGRHPLRRALVRVAAPWHRENGAAAMRALLDDGRRVRRRVHPQRHTRPRGAARAAARQASASRRTSR